MHKITWDTCIDREESTEPMTGSTTLIQQLFVWQAQSIQVLAGQVQATSAIDTLGKAERKIIK